MSKNYNEEKCNAEWWKMDCEVKKIRDVFRIRVKQNKKYTTQNPPLPNNPKGALELLKNYYGRIQFELQKYLFIDKYRIWNESSIKTEVLEIEQWIKDTEQLNYKDAILNYTGNINNPTSPQHEYLRLKKGFYEGFQMTFVQLSESSCTAAVYGRYFLFKDYLEDLESKMNGKVISTKHIFNKKYQTLREPLDLNFSSSISTAIQPCEKLEVHAKHLLSIANLRTRLKYYNKNVCSLSHFYNSDGLHSFGEYDIYHGHGDIIFIKSEKDKDFELYIQERKKEIDRLRSLIDLKETYFDKLKCFLEEKAGQIRFNDLKVESNDFVTFITSGGGEVPEHLLGNHTEINLQPFEPDERKSYNRYLRNFVLQLITDHKKFHC